MTRRDQENALRSRQERPEPREVRNPAPADPEAVLPANSVRVGATHFDLTAQTLELLRAGDVIVVPGRIGFGANTLMEVAAVRRVPAGEEQVTLVVAGEDGRPRQVEVDPKDLLGLDARVVRRSDEARAVNSGTGEAEVITTGALPYPFTIKLGALGDVDVIGECPGGLRLLVHTTNRELSLNAAAIRELRGDARRHAGIELETMSVRSGRALVDGTQGRSISWMDLEVGTVLNFADGGREEILALSPVHHGESKVVRLRTEPDGRMHVLPEMSLSDAYLQHEDGVVAVDVPRSVGQVLRQGRALDLEKEIVLSEGFSEQVREVLDRVGGLAIVRVTGAIPAEGTPEYERVMQVVQGFEGLNCAFIATPARQATIDDEGARGAEVPTLATLGDGVKESCPDAVVLRPAIDGPWVTREIPGESIIGSEKLKGGRSTGKCTFTYDHEPEPNDRELAASCSLTPAEWERVNPMDKWRCEAHVALKTAEIAEQQAVMPILFVPNGGSITQFEIELWREHGKSRPGYDIVLVEGSGRIADDYIKRIRAGEISGPKLHVVSSADELREILRRLGAVPERQEVCSNPENRPVTVHGLVSAVQDLMHQTNLAFAQYAAQIEDFAAMSTWRGVQALHAATGESGLEEAARLERSARTAFVEIVRLAQRMQISMWAVAQHLPDDSLGEALLTSRRAGLSGIESAIESHLGALEGASERAIREGNLPRPILERIAAELRSDDPVRQAGRDFASLRSLLRASLWDLDEAREARALPPVVSTDPFTPFLHTDVSWRECIEFAQLARQSHRSASDPHVALRGVTTIAKSPDAFASEFERGERFITVRDAPGRLLAFVQLMQPTEMASFVGPVKMKILEPLGRTSFVRGVWVAENAPAAVHRGITSLSRWVMGGRADHAVFKILAGNERSLKVHAAAGDLRLISDLVDTVERDGVQSQFLWYCVPTSQAAYDGFAPRMTHQQAYNLNEMVATRSLGGVFDRTWEGSRWYAATLIVQSRVLRSSDGSDRRDVVKQLRTLDGRVDALKERWKKTWANADELWEAVERGRFDVQPVPR